MWGWEDSSLFSSIQAPSPSTTANLTNLGHQKPCLEKGVGLGDYYHVSSRVLGYVIFVSHFCCFTSCFILYYSSLLQFQISSFWTIMEQRNTILSRRYIPCDFGLRLKCWELESTNLESHTHFQDLQDQELNSLIQCHFQQSKRQMSVEWNL